jgi:uncharacterized protein (DUF305 family)
LRDILHSIAAVLLLGALAVPAVAQTNAPMGGHAMPQDADTGRRGVKVPPPEPSTRAYKQAATQMHKDMGVRYTGDADRDFAAVMSGHHKGAVEMAKIELQYGHDPEMRQLAESIIASQEKEIALMQAWLAKQH